MFLTKDNTKLGLILGLIAPVAGFAAFYFLKFSLFSIQDFFEFLVTNKSQISGIVSVSLIANALIFTIYINTYKDKTAKGIFITTCFYGIIALAFKLFA